MFIHHTTQNLFLSYSLSPSTPTPPPLFCVCVQRFKTKLAASLARLRIKANLLTIADSLPERVKMKDERAHTLPVHAWVNTLKSRCCQIQHQRLVSLMSLSHFLEEIFQYIHSLGHIFFHHSNTSVMNANGFHLIIKEAFSVGIHLHNYIIHIYVKPSLCFFDVSVSL